MKSNRRPKLQLVAIGVALTLLGVSLYPIASFYTRLLCVVLVVCLWLLLVTLSWSSRLWRRCLVCVAIVAGALLLAPGRGVRDPHLAERYVAELRRYRGTRYVWGGENRLGIDCSGLVRSALVNAAVRRGIVTVNPSLVRLGVSLWWHDRTARQLGEGYRGDTVPIAVVASANAAGASGLRIGDLAVTVSGIHVLAYVGNGTWVEADPDAHAVLEVQAPEGTNPWFNAPVSIVRWRALSGEAV
jgi:NlpC/P60 family protein